jgi:hypothetical protein
MTPTGHMIQENVGLDQEQGCFACPEYHMMNIFKCLMLALDLEA